MTRILANSFQRFENSQAASFSTVSTEICFNVDLSKLLLVPVGNYSEVKKKIVIDKYTQDTRYELVYKKLQTLEG